jgi:hypothetical protein
MIELAQDGHSKNVPYTTKSGLQIGSRYTPQQRSYMSSDEEYWQCVLLGIKPSPSMSHVIYFVIYLAILVMIFVVVALAVQS